MKLVIKTVEDLKSVKDFMLKKKAEAYTVEIKVVKDIRSLEQNAMYWVLCEALARKMGEHKEYASSFFKKEYMKEKSINKWIETHLLDTADMSQFIDYCFWFLINIAEGYLDDVEGKMWLDYLGGKNG